MKILYYEAAFFDDEVIAVSSIIFTDLIIIDVSNNKPLNYLYFIATIITVSLVLLYYHPYFLSVTDAAVGSSLSKYVYVATAALCAMSFNFSKWLSTPFAKKYIIYLIAAALVGVILALFHVTRSYLHQSRALLLPLMFFLTG